MLYRQTDVLLIRLIPVQAKIFLVAVEFCPTGQEKDTRSLCLASRGQSLRPAVGRSSAASKVFLHPGRACAWTTMSLPDNHNNEATPADWQNAAQQSNCNLDVRVGARCG
jgi:hypothetical protein